MYLGLLIFCGFVLFDTQMIIERKERGDDDYIWHSVDLFIDFMAIFKRLLIILAKKVIIFNMTYYYELTAFYFLYRKRNERTEYNHLI